MRILDTHERFWSRVNIQGPTPVFRPSLGPCWVWTHKTNNKGYPLFNVNGARIPAYHYSYEAEKGSVPPGLELDHLCRVPLCVRPSHLEAVPHAENQRRMGEAKTHCKHGHKYTKDTTYITRNGHRKCRECARIRDRARGRKRGPVAA